jgi:hypothetical protein
MLWMGKGPGSAYDKMNISVVILWHRYSTTVNQVILLTLPEHLSSPPVFSWVPVTLSLVLYVCFVDLCLSCCTFSFCHLLSVLLRCTNSDYLPLVSSNSSYVLGEHQRPATSHWQTLSHNVVSTTPRNERGSNWQLLDKVCQWLVAGRWCSPSTSFPPPIKLTVII